MSEYGRPQVSDEKKEMMNTILNEDPMMSLKTSATQAGQNHAAIWSFLK